MKIGVIGAGRLGICLALLLEKAGYDVMVSDCRDDYVIGLNNRIIATNEPQVAEMLDDAKNFIAVLDNVEVIKNCDIIFTLVATPSLEDGSYDVSAKGCAGYEAHSPPLSTPQPQDHGAGAVKS